MEGLETDLETEPAEEVRISNLKTRAGRFYACVWVPMVGLLLLKYIIPRSLIPESILNSSLLSVLLLLVIAVGIIGGLNVRCEFCRKGWRDYREPILKNLFRKKSSGWNYPTETPDKCPTCGALFK